MRFKIIFKNSITGSPEDWTKNLSVVTGLNRKVESENKGEAGILAYDRVQFIFEYKNGSPVYNAFNIDLTAIQRYVIEVFGIKTDNGEIQQFQGLIDFSTLEFPDDENYIEFAALGKLSALDVLAAEPTRTLGNLLNDVNPDPQADRITYRKFKNRNDFNLEYSNSSTLVRQTTEANTPDVGDLIQIHFLKDMDADVNHVGLITFKYFDNTYSDGRVFYGIKTNYKNWFTDSTDQDDTGTADPIVRVNSKWWGDLFNNQDIYIKQWRTNYPITQYVHPGPQTVYVSGWEIIAIDALKIIEAIYEKVWGNVNIVNKSGSSTFPIATEFALKLIDENPFGKHPKDALKMLADSMQCYIYPNKQGDLVIQKRNNLGSNGITRTLDPYKKVKGRKKHFWDKRVDEVIVILNSWVLDENGEYLQGQSKLQKNPNIKARNSLTKEILAIDSSLTTKEQLDAEAAIVANEYFNFYGKRHSGYSLQGALYDDILDWELLDNIILNGQQYFFVSLILNYIENYFEAELASVTAYNYDFSSAHIAKTENNSDSPYYQSASGQSSTSVVISNNYGDIISSLDQLDTTKGLLVQTGDTTFTKEKFDTINNQFLFHDSLNTENKDGSLGDIVVKINPLAEFQAQKIGIGIEKDSSYFLKVGDGINQDAAWFRGNIKVDGNIYIGGNINQVNEVNLNVQDKTIRINVSGDNTTAIGSGIVVEGTSESDLAKIIYDGNWSFDKAINTSSSYKINNVDRLNNTSVNLATGGAFKVNDNTIVDLYNIYLGPGGQYKINGSNVLNVNTLGATVVNSSLSKVGTLTQGIWNATKINADYINYNTTNLKNSYSQLNTIQDIHVGASPTFVDGNLTGRLNQQGTNDSEFGSQYIIPKQKYYSSLGTLQKKYLTIHAAELWVETLVAQETVATIGGRVVVSPTTSLTRDLAPSENYIYTKHNEMSAGDTLWMESSGKLEWMYVTSNYTYIGVDEYRYSVTRNLDGTGANQWYAGDAIVNTGQTGEGFIDIYSVHGIKSVSNYGPTIVGNVRNSSTYNDYSEAWAIGNLRGNYGYAYDVYGVGLGKYSSGITNIVIDPINGIRFRDYNTTIAKWVGSVLTLGEYGYGKNHLGMTNDTIVIKNYNTVLASWVGKNITLGEVTSGKNNLVINDNSIQFKNYTTVIGSWTGTSMTLGEVTYGKSNIYLNNGSIYLRNYLSNVIGLIYDGSGFLANNNISWDANGNTKVANWNIDYGNFWYGNTYKNTSGNIIIGNNLVGNSNSYSNGFLIGYAGYNTNPLINISNSNLTLRLFSDGTRGYFGLARNSIWRVRVGSMYVFDNSWGDYYGFAVVDNSGNALFRADDGGNNIFAGFNFDLNKFYVGSSTAGFALNKSSSPFLNTTIGKGFEVYDVNNPKLFVGYKNGAFLDWNISAANALTLNSAVLKFSTLTTQGQFSESINDRYVIIHSTDVSCYDNNTTSSSINYKTWMDGYRVYSENYNASSKSIYINSLIGTIKVGSFNVPKFLGVTNSPSTSNRQLGDTYMNIYSKYFVWNGSSWIGIN